MPIPLKVPAVFPNDENFDSVNDFLPDAAWFFFSMFLVFGFGKVCVNYAEKTASSPQRLIIK